MTREEELLLALAQTASGPRDDENDPYNGLSCVALRLFPWVERWVYVGYGLDVYEETAFLVCPHCHANIEMDIHTDAIAWLNDPSNHTEDCSWRQTRELLKDRGLL